MHTCDEVYILPTVLRLYAKGDRSSRNQISSPTVQQLACMYSRIQALMQEIPHSSLIFGGGAYVRLYKHAQCPHILLCLSSCRGTTVLYWMCHIPGGKAPPHRYCNARIGELAHLHVRHHTVRLCSGEPLHGVVQIDPQLFNFGLGRTCKTGYIDLVARPT